MGFDGDFRKLKLSFEVGNVHIRAVDAKHGVFVNSMQRHMHSFYELHYIVGGEGKVILDDEEHMLSEGDLFLTAPKVYHAQINNPENCMEEYCFSFEVGRTKKECEISRFFDDDDFYICKDRYNIKALFEELENELANTQTGYISAIKAILELIIVNTVRNFSHKQEDDLSERSVPDDRRSLIMDEAFLFSYRELTLEYLAKLLNLGVRHTQRLVYEKYGMSFVEMRMQMRLDAAENMLRKNEFTLGEIADKCGFSSYVHFSRSFKKRFGILPSEYKRELLKREDKNDAEIFKKD